VDIVVYGGKVDGSAIRNGQNAVNRARVRLETCEQGVCIRKADVRDGHESPTAVQGLACAATALGSPHLHSATGARCIDVEDQELDSVAAHRSMRDGALPKRIQAIAADVMVVVSEFAML
jgi:hypothetical protein